MSSTIKIKRSETSGNPSVLGSGELAYSALADNGSNGGDRLYIGIGVETNGNAVNHLVIGGKYFTDKLNHTPGVLTPSAALIADESGKLDNILVDNISLNGNTVSATNTNGDLVLTGSGTGGVSISGAYILPTTDGSTGYILTTDGNGTVTWEQAAANLPIIADNSTSATIDLLTESLTITGGTGIVVEIDDLSSTITITPDLATTTTVGIAKFAPEKFIVTDGLVDIGTGVIEDIVGNMVIDNVESDISVTYDATARKFDFNVADLALTFSGDITAVVTPTGLTAAVATTIADGAVTNSKLANSSITIGSTAATLGDTVTTITGLTSLTSGNVTVISNEIQATGTATDINLALVPKGNGTVVLPNIRIEGVDTPIARTDAANKGYVDDMAQGISAKPAVSAATTTNLVGVYDNGTLGVGATLTLPASAALDIDGITSWSVYSGILVKSQTNAFENGRYYVSQVGDISTNWILTRCGYCDEASEIPSGYVWVQGGNTFASTGWVANVENYGSFIVGTDDIIWVQFSGSGSYQAGEGLGLLGNIFYLKTATNSGLEILADELQLSSSLAGNGLNLTSGVLTAVGTSSRISVDANGIDIDVGYIGQASITTLGTISTGVWNGTTIAAAYGGTGLTSYVSGDLLLGNVGGTLSKLALGDSGKILQSNGTTLVYGDIDGGTY